MTDDARAYEAAWMRGDLPPCTPGDEEWLRRRDLLMGDERVGWWWLSFLNTDLPYLEEEDRPGGYRHLGVCLVPGGNIAQAAGFAHLLGCNPGGRVSGYPLPLAPRAEYVGKLYVGDEAHRIAALEPHELMEVDP